MGMLLFTAFKLVESGIKKTQAGAGAGVVAVAAGAVGVATQYELFPLVGRPSALRPVCRLYLLISPQSLVCWLAFLCPSLCPFMQDIISHCWTLSACPQTEPNRATGPCPALCALCVCVTFGSTPLPHTGSKRMKPQNGHVLVHAVRTVPCAMRHCPFVALLPMSLGGGTG